MFENKFRGLAFKGFSETLARIQTDNERISDELCDIREAMSKLASALDVKKEEYIVPQVQGYFFGAHTPSRIDWRYVKNSPKGMKKEAARV